MATSDNTPDPENMDIDAADVPVPTTIDSSFWPTIREAIRTIDPSITVAIQCGYCWGDIYIQGPAEEGTFESPAVILACGHVACMPCLSAWVTDRLDRVPMYEDVGHPAHEIYCPMCRSQLACESCGLLFRFIHLERFPNDIFGLNAAGVPPTHPEMPDRADIDQRWKTWCNRCRAVNRALMYMERTYFSDGVRQQDRGIYQDMINNIQMLITEPELELLSDGEISILLMGLPQDAARRLQEWTRSCLAQFDQYINEEIETDPYCYTSHDGAGEPWGRTARLTFDATAPFANPPDHPDDVAAEVAGFLNDDDDL